MMPNEFRSLSNLTKTQEAQFARYFELLVDWNSRMNLTAITDESSVYEKHFYDSTAPVRLGLVPNQTIKLLDIGAGAGFPSIPMKILCPKLEVTIIDSLQKRIDFLSNLTETLGLSNVTLLHGRAEDFGQDTLYRGQFDLVTARAVARLNVLLELTIPFLKEDARLLSLKAVKFDDELTEAQNALKALGARLIETRDYELTDGATRHIAVITKTKPTPKKYPRKAGTPNKKPL
ncbi:MAG: 16S rRNA (guanine(527)-N(7))-methyltransferase RsmG [Streptococcaceae bacterium]|jgi:16S rRNA (guanine527-N7)-methyltransferase|nr:16S rRNA (guanine(527)-N(7))-methyltransferase RsmG [Streptococcaceae bacterium]